MPSPVTCPICGGDNSTVTGGNDWFCFAHYAECMAELEASNASRLAESAARRKASAQKAVVTKAAIKAGTYQARPKNMEAYRRIKACCATGGR